MTAIGRKRGGRRREHSSIVLRGDGGKPARAKFDLQTIDYTGRVEMTRAAARLRKNSEPASATVVSVDYMQSGIGSNSCEA